MTLSKAFRYILVSFIVGIGTRSFIDIPIILVWGGSLGAMMVLVYAFRHENKNLAAMALMVLGCAVGVGRFMYVEWHIPDVSMLSYHRIKVVGMVNAEPNITETTQRLILAVQKIQDSNMSVAIPIFLQLRKYPAYHEGDIIRAEGMFEDHAYDGKTNGILFVSQEEKRMPLVFPSYACSSNIPSARIISPS